MTEWTAQVNDLVGGWIVTTYPHRLSAHDTRPDGDPTKRGQIIAECCTEADATTIAELLNLGPTGVGKLRQEIEVWREIAGNYLDEREQQTARWIEAAAERDAAESSRRDWAAEAMRLEMEWENLARLLDEQGELRDRHGSTEGCDEDGCDDLGECHTSAAVATWFRAATLVKRRLAELRDLSRPVCAVHEEGQ